MKNNRESFYGQQEGEKILATVESHPIGKWTNLAKLYSGSLALWLVGAIIGSQLPTLTVNTGFIGFFLALAVAVLGTLAIVGMEKNAITYITDRRIIRFHPHNPFATTTRALTWDQATKVKTYPKNIVHKMMKIGMVIVHAKTTTNDDVELENIPYYKDLGNYIDKIIYIFNREPENMVSIRPFIAKPKGMRY